MIPGVIWIIPALISTSDDAGLCIFYIAKRYFTEHQPIHISSLSTGDDLDSFLNTLHRTALWSVEMYVVGNERLTAEFDYMAKQQSCVVFTSGNDDLIDQMEELKMKSSWNPRAKYLVVGEQLNAEEIAQEMRKNYNVMNIIILSSYFGRLHLFSWSAYQSAEKCRKIDLFLVDTWSVSDRSCLQNHSQLFTNKIQTNFHTCELRASAMHCPTFVNPLEGNDYRGVEADLFKFVAQRLNFNVTFHPFAYLDSYEGGNKLMEALSLDVIDVAFGCLPWHPIIKEYADTTITYLQDTLKWMVPCGKPFSRTKKIGQTFSPLLWATMSLVLVSMITTLWLYARHNCTESVAYRSFSNCCYFVWSVTIGISVPRQPRSPKIRLIFITLVWYCFVMSVLFQTFFVSNLVDPGLEKQVETLEELYQEGYTLYVQSGTAVFFKDALGKSYDELKLPIVQCPLRACLDEYLNLPKVVTITCRVFIEYQLMERLPPGMNAPKLCLMEEDLYVLFYGFHLQKGSPLLAAFNSMLRRTLETGVFEKIKTDLMDVFRYTQLNASEMLNVPIEENVEYFVFSMTHLAIAFYVLAFGCFLSFLLFLGETFSSLVVGNNTRGA